MHSETGIQTSSSSKKATHLILIGYLFALSGSVIGVIIGETIRTKVINSPADRPYFKYAENTRKHGKLISTIAAFTFYIGLVLSMLT